LRVLILGADGYLGWPTALRFSAKGDEVLALDSGVKRVWEREVGAMPLCPTLDFTERARRWSGHGGSRIETVSCDLCDYHSLAETLRGWRPDAIVHYAEQPSAPFSMMSAARAALTQTNNVVGTLNLLWAMREVCPEAHLIKLGTMGQYGTPNIDIEEGFLDIEHKGRRDRLPFPSQPGSFYHLSKVHDSHNLRFACAAWGLAATDLNQGVVYGIATDETAQDPDQGGGFHYDAVFGTALNRFCVQAVAGTPLTVYGAGLQKRGFINIRDTLDCVDLAARHPARPGQYRVFNQFTEVFSIGELADHVVRSAAEWGLRATVQRIDNPRSESAEHYYNPVAEGLKALGLSPRLLTSELVQSMLRAILPHASRIDLSTIRPATRWR
jgi:UDP-sulfoquinovose synthase